MTPAARFVSDLRQEDFQLFEDDAPQQVTHFSAERVPVSLGILLDTSQSMAGEKFESARGALERFLDSLSSADDEFFLMRFSSTPALLQGWTSDRDRIDRALARTAPGGGTAMYDAIAQSVPMTRNAKNRKKALVIISDGNDMTSVTRPNEVHRVIRESEVLVYAVGIDCSGADVLSPAADAGHAARRGADALSVSDAARPTRRLAAAATAAESAAGTKLRPVQRSGRHPRPPRSHRRQRRAHRAGQDSRDLNPATAGIADELSKQYYLGYPSAGKKDGRWHTIRVEVRNKACTGSAPGAATSQD